jgi:hypothetical protein
VLLVVWLWPGQNVPPSMGTVLAVPTFGITVLWQTELDRRVDA